MSARLLLVGDALAWHGDLRAEATIVGLHEVLDIIDKAIGLRIDDGDLVLLINHLGIDHSLPMNLLEIAGDRHLQVAHLVEVVFPEPLFRNLVQRFFYLIFCYGRQRLHAIILHFLDVTVWIDLLIWAHANHFSSSGTSLRHCFLRDFVEPQQ
jgi:hypothetical protein